ncbi:MAG: hypothetical protein RL272_1263 [Candidatus Parcubacteria bacterium]
MIGKPLTAKDWDSKLDTAAGGTIVRLLAPFHEMPLRLERPAPHLEKEVPAALYCLGRQPKSTAVVSRDAFMAAVLALPPHARRGAEMGLVVGLADSMSLPLCAIMDREERPSAYDLAFRLLNESLFGAFVARMDRDFGRLSDTGLRLGVQQSLCQHVAALASGRGDLAQRVEPFTSMYASGNWPVGIMKDDGFLVLVR